jgi:hypothetical protein
MAYYRLHLLGVEEHILHSYAVEAESDQVAIARARALGHIHKIAVWQERRKVGVVEPPATTSPAD